MSIKQNITSLQSLLEQVNSLPEAGGEEQATPIISVNTSGLITATAGTKSSTHQLAFQPAKIITPSTTSQIAVSSGHYTGGDITVDAIPLQYVVPSGTLTISANGTHDVKNYASAVVNVESSGGSEQVEWSENEDAIVSRNIRGAYTNSRISTIGVYAFYYCSNLTSVNFPVCTKISMAAFHNCYSLASVSFPVCTSIGNSAFYNCYSLTSVNFPVCTTMDGDIFHNCTNLVSVNFPAATTIGRSAFYSCHSLTSVSFPVCTTIRSSAFNYCYTLSQFYLTGSSVCTLSNSNAFYSTPYAGYSTYFSGTPYIYVPASLVSAYQSATNWAYFSSYFSAIEGGDGGNIEDEIPEDEIPEQ